MISWAKGSLSQVLGQYTPKVWDLPVPCLGTTNDDSYQLKKSYIHGTIQ